MSFVRVRNLEADCNWVTSRKDLGNTEDGVHVCNSSLRKPDSHSVMSHRVAFNALQCDTLF